MKSKIIYLIYINTLFVTELALAVNRIKPKIDRATFMTQDIGYSIAAFVAVFGLVVWMFNSQVGKEYIGRAIVGLFGLGVVSGVVVMLKNLGKS